MAEKDNQIKDNINPEHYKKGKQEVIDIMIDQLSPEEFKGFCKGLIIKYLCRADYKNGLEDYKKAQWYLNKLVEVMDKWNSAVLHLSKTLI